MATLLDVDIFGEFAEPTDLSLARPELRELLALVFWEKLDYVIVSSRDRLTRDQDDAFEVAWRLGFAHTNVVAADAADEFVWAGM